MEKPTKRKAFNFLRSYFDVLNELDKNEDKLNFLLSIINKQFLDEDPKDLNFIVNLCYSSQKHAVEKSVKGWKTANKTNLLGDPLAPCTPPPKGDPTPPPKEEEEEEQVQEKEKGKEKGKVEEEDVYSDIDFILIDYLKNRKLVLAFCENQKIQPSDLESYLKKFNIELKNKGQLVKTDKDYKSHFFNWFRKKREIEQKSSAKKESKINNAFSELQRAKELRNGRNN